MNTGIKETTELLSAASSLVLRTIRNLADDGRISLIEGAGYLAEIGHVKDAINGIKQAPSELADLSEEELEALREQIRATLIEAGVTHRTADITERCILWIRDTVNLALFIKNAPPTALPV